MANTPISGLNPGGPVKDTDLFPDVQTVGVGPVKVTGAQIKTYTSNSPNLVTPNIGVATGTSLSLNTSGSYSTTIQSSGSATQSWTFVLPPDDGTNGYILTTNGSGVSAWTNPTALGIDIDVNSTAITGGTNGHLIYDNAGKFGEMSAITTDGASTLTLGIQQTTQGIFVLANTAAGAFSTTIKSSNSSTESWALTLPVSKGSNGYVLTTDGTGVSSWTNPTSLDIDINVNSTSITGGTTGRLVYDNSGTFGEVSAITTNGSDTLTVGSQQTTQGNIVLSNTAAGAFPVTVKSSNSTSSAWSFTLPTTAGTNKYALTTDGSGVSSWSQIDLAASVTGTLPVNHGGTGQSTLAQHGVVIGNAASGVNVTATGSAGQVFQSGGAAADPVWSTATYPSTATGIGTILRADGTNWTATVTAYPATTTINQLLYSDANNNLTGLTTGNGGVLNTNSTGVPSITANPTLGVQQTMQGSIVLANTAAGAFSTTIKSSNAATEAWSLTLPVSKGTNGYILTTDGTGISSWTNPTALGIDIDVNSTAITSGTSGRLVYDNAGTFGEISAITTNGSDTLTVGVQQTTQGKIVLDNTAAGAFQTTIQSSNSASAAWTLTLPTTAGTNGYILTTNGSGVTSWTNPTTFTTEIIVGTTPTSGGASGQLMFDTGSVLQESANLTWDNSNVCLGVGIAPYTGHSLAAGRITSDTGYAARAEFQLRRADGTSGAPTTVISGDELGNISYQGWDGSAWRQGASILGVADDTITGSSFPGRITFRTTPAGTQSVVERMRIDNAGAVGIGATPIAGQTLFIAKNITGSVNSTTVRQQGIVQKDVTSSVISFDNVLQTVADSFTLTDYRHYNAQQSTIGVGSAVTNQYGFFAAGTLTGASNNYGFYSAIASGANRWNFYSAGTADNYFAGNIGVGNSTPSYKLDVTGSGHFTGALTLDTVLAVSSGGTGNTTNTIHGVLLGNAGNAINATTAGSAGQHLQSGGAGADPNWTTATFPSTATSTGAILRADGTNWSATTATYPTTTSAGTILASGSANTVTASATPTLGVAGSTVGSVAFANATSGSITLSPTTGALGSSTITMPATTGTMTVLGNSTTGSGNIVRATSPSLTTPSLGVASGTSLALGGATIGTNALAITGTSLLDGVQWINVNSTTTSQYLKFGDGTTAYAAVGGYYDSATTGHIEFYGSTGGALTEYMRITNAGDVGIGTGSPGTKLNVYTNSGTNTFVRVQNTAGYADLGPLAGGTIYGPYCSPAASTSLTFGTSNANPIRIYTNGSERARVDSTGNFVINTAAIATTATDGFLYIPTCAGAPTGVPTAYTGRNPIVYDSTNNKLYIYNGAWKSATFA